MINRIGSLKPSILGFQGLAREASVAAINHVHSLRDHVTVHGLLHSMMRNCLDCCIVRNFCWVGAEAGVHCFRDMSRPVHCARVALVVCARLGAGLGAL